ncbi:MAG: pilus assembly FimT family protein, partial [Planctomycetota bacterium]
GFTSVEVILVVLIIGILAVIAVPRLNFAVISKHKAEATARKIATDLRRTRGLAISEAATNTKGFSLEMSGGPPYTNYQIVNDDTEATVDSHTIDSTVNCTGGVNFEFGHLGNLELGSDSQLTVSASGKTFTITIIRATGTVKCVEN